MAAHREEPCRGVNLRYFLAKPALSGRKAGYFTHVGCKGSFALVPSTPC